MNYSGKFGSLAPGPHSGEHFDFDAASHRGDANTVTIPDSHLLFSGDYARSGTDLIVSDQFHRVVVPNYFHGDKRPTLVSPEGAPLDPSVIEALTGHVQYAQAGGIAAAGKVVGHVVKMTGSASIVRNGVTIDLNNGDAVYQNDVVQTGSGSTLGLVLIDGTTFNLTAGARLMLNELNYEANSTSNSSLFTLVQGAANFVAGQVAKTGDMKVGTPVATMGIRGTAVILDISATDGKVSISVVDQQDGQVHSVQVYNPQGILIGTVTSNGSTLTLTPVTTFEIIAQQSNKTTDQIAQEFNAFQGLLNTYDVGRQLVPSTPPPTDGKRGDANPQTPTKFAGTTILPSDSTTTHFNAPVGGNTTGQQTGGTGTSVNYQSTTTPSGPTGQPTPTDPLVGGTQTVVVPTTSLPFVVTPPTVSRVSADGDHFGPVMSADGHFIVYDPDGAIYLYDRATNTTLTIATPAGGFTYSGQTISADGRHVVYQGSDGTNSYVFIYNNDPADTLHYQQTTQLGPGGAPAISGDGSIIVVEHGGTSIGIYEQGNAIVTITPASIAASGAVWRPSISADGHVIAFWNTDDTAVGGSGHLFTYDLSTGAVTHIADAQTDAGTSAASFSADGRYVTYQSDAPGGHSEIYLYDLSTGQVVFSTANAIGASYNPVISPDGHYIIFASDAHLTSGDTNSVTDTYVVDLTNPAHPVYTLVSALADGTQGNDASNGGATISIGGLYIAFASHASNLSAGDTPGTGDIFVVDPTSGRSAIIQESVNAPAILVASGVITLTGDRSGVTLSVSDPSRFTASFDANGNIQWSFSEPKSDFASLLPGQFSHQNFVITLSTGGSTTTIPVRVTVYDADQPAVVVVNAAPVATPINLGQEQEDKPFVITSETLLAGVGDIDGPSLSITAVVIQSGGGTISSNGEGYWTYTPPAEFNGTVVFRYTASDGNKTATSTASLNITGPNDAPTISGGDNFTVAEDTPLTITTLAISDVDAGSSPISVTLSVHHGMLALNSTAGLTGDFNGSDGTVSLTGSQAAINAALASGLVYTPESNYGGNSELTVTVNDLGNSGSGGAQSATEQFYINVTPVNDAPTVAEPGSSIYFLENDDTTGNPELWQFDASGHPVRIAAIEYGGEPLTTVSGSPTNVTPPTFFQGAYYFNGTQAGTTQIYRLDLDGTVTKLTNDNLDHGGVAIISPVEVGGELFFRTQSPNGEQQSDGLLRIDSAGSIQQVSYDAGPEGYIYSAAWAAEFDGTIYFVDGNEGAFNAQLLKFDASGHLVQIAAIEYGGQLLTTTSGSPFNMTPPTFFNGAFYFNGTQDNITQIYRLDLDGTVTQLTDDNLANGGVMMRIMHQVGGELFLRIDSAVAGPVGNYDGLLRIDDSGQIQYVNHDDGPNGYLNPNSMAATSEGTIYFLSNNGTTGHPELYQLDASDHPVRIATVEYGGESLSVMGGGAGSTFFDGAFYFDGTQDNVTQIYRLDLDGTVTRLTNDNLAHGGVVMSGTTQVGGEIFFRIVSADGQVAISDGLLTIDSTGAIQHVSHDVGPEGVLNPGSAAESNAPATPILAAVAEDTADPAGRSVGDIFGDRFSDVDAGSSLVGVAIVANHATAAQGQWQYMSPEHGYWEDVGTASASHALAFSLGTMLRFVPAADFNGTPGTLEVRGLDNTFDPEDFTIGSDPEGGYRHTIDTTVNGGSTAISGGPAVTLSTSVTPEVDAPTFSGDTTGSVAEHGYVESGGTVHLDTDGGTLTVHDADNGESSFLPVVDLDALNGDYGHFTFDAGSGDWTYTLNHEYAGSLYAGQVVHDTLTVTSADNTDQIIDVTITGANDAPSFDGDSLTPTPTVAPGGAAVAIATGVEVRDIDSADYDDGTLTVTVTNGHAGDALSIAAGGLITVSGSNVSFDTNGTTVSGGVVQIGTYSGGGSSSLIVTLNVDASNAAIAALTEAIRFSTSDTTGGTRTVAFTLDDGDGTANGGQNSDFFAATVLVTGTNHAPVITAAAADNHVLSSPGYISGNTVDQTLQLTGLNIAGDADVTFEFWANLGDDSQMPVGFGLYDLFVTNFEGVGKAIGFNTGNGDLFGVARGDLVGQWHHYAAVFHNGNSTLSKLYIDGQAQTLTEFGTNPNNYPNYSSAIITDDPHVGGWNYDAQYPIDGQIDDLRIYHGAREASDIVSDMNGGFTGTGLVAAYSFEGVTAGAVTDVSGNNHHGTLVGLTAANVIADSLEVAEDGILVFSNTGHNGISVADVDGDDVTVTLTVGHGILTLGDPGQVIIIEGADGSATVTISGSTSAINAALGGLSYQPDSNYNGNDTLVVDASDGALDHTRTIDLVINPVNDDPGGLPAIQGVPEVGTQLTALTIGEVTDADDFGTFSYQWQRSNGSEFTDIAGATGDFYALTEADRDHAVRVVVSYVDGGGTFQTVTSLETEPVTDPQIENEAPLAVNDTVFARPQYGSIASTLTYNDSDPDGDAFHISGAAHAGNPAGISEQFGAYLVQGNYGTLLLFPAGYSETVGGNVINFFNPGDYLFIIGGDVNGNPLGGNLPIYDLQPGQTLSDTFTYSITDIHGAQSLEDATITVVFEASYVDLSVQRYGGYDTTTLRNDLKIGLITDINSTYATVQIGNFKTILIDAKALTWSGSVEDENVILTGGLIKGFHVSDLSGPLFSAVNYNIPAALFDGAVGHTSSVVFDGILADYGYDSFGSVGADVLRGGDLSDFILTGGGADTVNAGNGNDIIAVYDNAAWHIDGGAGIDTIRVDGPSNLVGAPQAQSATSIEIIDLYPAYYANAIVVEPEGLFEINENHVLRVLGGLTDTVVLGRNYPGVTGDHWVAGQTEINYTGDGYSVTAGVLFDQYEYRDGAQTLATLYVQHGVMVDDGPVILSNNLQTMEVGFGAATVSGLSIADGDVDALTITAVAGHGTLAPVGPPSAINNFDNGGDGILWGTGSLASINQMLAEGLTYTPNVNTPPVTDMVTLTINDGHSTDTLNFIFNVTGANPALYGTAGKDILYGTGGNDQFVFAATTGTGHDTIINFTPGQDDITLDYVAFQQANGPNDFAHWLASHATAFSGGVLIDLNRDNNHLNQDTILLKNVMLANLHANDFILPSS